MRTLLICLALVFRLGARAQPNTLEGKITGSVADSATAKPVDFVSVVVMLDGKEISGTTTDETGNFVVDHLAFATYKVVFYSVGYKKSEEINVTLSKDRPTKSLGIVRLINLVRSLEEVSVVAKTEIIENRVDKIVYNTANDITSQGGAAIDVLKKVPHVTVDADGNVELQGSSNIRFLIDGKPSSMFGNSLADALASIPSSQIKSIEVIAAPGAKYDAQGTGGIINIVLKTNKINGVNGNMNLTAGTRFENGSFNLNFKKNKFGIGVFANANAQLTSRTPVSQDRSSIDITSSTTTHLLQSGYTDFQRRGYRTGVSFEWTPAKHHNFNGSLSYSQFSNKSIGLLNQDQHVLDYSVNNEQVVSGYRTSDSRTSTGSVDCSLSYRKNFKREGQELSADYVASIGSPNSSYHQSQSLNGAAIPYNGISGSNPGSNTTQYLSIDYVHPITGDVTIETGAKTTQQHLNSVTNVSLLNPASDIYESDASRSYSLKYDMAIYAGYVSASFKMFHWLDARAGGRFEHTDLKIDFPGTHLPSYDLVVPSIILSHKFKKEQTMKLSYVRRIERPEYTELNPFLNFSDPHNLTVGNPNLRPEIADNFEFNFSKTLKNGGNISLSAVERINSQDLKQITTFYPNFVVGDSVYSNVSVTTRSNVGLEYNSGGIVSASFPLTENLNLRGNFMAFHRYMVTTIYVGNLDMGMRYRANLNLSYQLPKDLILEAFGNFNSAAKNIQGYNPQFVTYTFALRKQIWNKKASFGFTATNPFNKYVRQVTTVHTGDYDSYSVRDLPYRSFGVTFSYKFGKMDFKKPREDTNDYINGPAQTN